MAVYPVSSISSISLVFMAIITLKAWYLQDYEPARELEKRPPDLRLSKSSLLKSALRADFLDEAENVRQSEWFQRCLEGDTVEFYIEGSGGYAIANIDLVSHEMYFTKREVLANLDPTIFFSYQTAYGESSEILRQALRSAIDQINKKARVPLTLEESNRLSDGPLRLQSTLMRKLRRSLLLVADATPVLLLEGDLPLLFPSPEISVEIGYALQCKRAEQILIGQMARSNMPGQFPFDVPPEQRFQFKDEKELRKSLRSTLEKQLKRFNVL